MYLRICRAGRFELNVGGLRIHRRGSELIAPARRRPGPGLLQLNQVLMFAYKTRLFQTRISRTVHAQRFVSLVSPNPTYVAYSEPPDLIVVGPRINRTGQAQTTPEPNYM